MVDREELRKTQDVIAITSQQAERLKVIKKVQKHDNMTDTVELLLNAYDELNKKTAPKDGQ